MSIFATARLGATTAMNSISNLRGGVDSLVNKYILKPKGMRGISGFVFDGPMEDVTQFSADITDHYIENNSFINDHVAIRPIRLVLKGFVGELVFNSNPTGLLGLLGSAQNFLTTVPAYLGKYTPKGIQDIQKAITKGTSIVNKVDGYLARAKNIVGMFTGGTNKINKQTEAYTGLKNLFINRVICSVETPYEYFRDSMIIESLVFRQSDDDKYRTDISVTLKELRVSQVSVSPISKLTTGGRALFQRQSPVDGGKSKGTAFTFGSKLSLGTKLNGKGI